MNPSSIEAHDNSIADSFSSRLLAALSNPSIRIGPFTWHYLRETEISYWLPLLSTVEVPGTFAELSVPLTRKRTGICRHHWKFWSSFIFDAAFTA
uniref:Uncharacterized protein n=1 Tax=Physcomitrium patens TaxID=3218 RepID=A0A2K1JK34_PHYPA|nr:hypothetical protein PHYPA_019009 [Physcomitrium patens]